MATFENPANGYHVKVGTLGPFIWTLLFGALYFLVKGSFKHFLLGIILGMCTLGISWLIYPFFSPGIIRRMYLEKGYRQIDSGATFVAVDSMLGTPHRTADAPVAPQRRATSSLGRVALGAIVVLAAVFGLARLFDSSGPSPSTESRPAPRKTTQEAALEARRMESPPGMSAGFSPEEDKPAEEEPLGTETVRTEEETRSPAEETAEKGPRPKTARQRTWTSGKHTVEAEFVKAIGKTVYLKRLDTGGEIAVPMEKLSEEDQEFIRKQMWKD